MQSRFGGDSQSVAEVVVAVQAVEKQREPLDDEVAVVGKSRAHVPRMALLKEVAFDVESDVHRLENRFHAAVFAQRNGSRVAVGQAELEVEMPVAPAKIQQGIEFLQVVVRKQAVQVAVLQIERTAFRLQQVNLVLQVDGVAVQGRALVAETDVKVLKHLTISFQGQRCAAARSACVAVLGVGLQRPLRSSGKGTHQQCKC